MQGGLRQKPSTSASTWYGVQHATKQPSMKEIVRNALRARFSDFDFCRPPPTNSGIFFLLLKCLPIECIKSRLLEFRLAASPLASLCDFILDGLLLVFEVLLLLPPVVLMPAAETYPVQIVLSICAVLVGGGAVESMLLVACVVLANLLVVVVVSDVSRSSIFSSCAGGTVVVMVVVN